MLCYVVLQPGHITAVGLFSICMSATSERVSERVDCQNHEADVLVSCVFSRLLYVAETWSLEEGA